MRLNRFLSPSSLPPQACSAVLLAILCLGSILNAQRSLPYMDPARNSSFAQIDFAKIYLNQQAWEEAENKNGQIRDQQLMDSGGVSVRDLEAPSKAIKQFNRGTSYLRSQNSKDAIRCLEKAVGLYPEFVSAHLALGLAYFDQQDQRAHDEFKTAATLDDQFPLAFFNLGITELLSHEYGPAESDLQKAANLSPNDTKILTALAFAQSGTQNYTSSFHTAERVHQLGDRGLAHVHYIAAAAALNLRDVASAQRELNALIAEDPANAFAPMARKQLETLQDQQSKKSESQISAVQNVATGPIIVLETFPNSNRLQSQLGALGDDMQPGSCETCDDFKEPIPHVSNTLYDGTPTYRFSAPKRDEMFTIRQAVDETALFLSVSRQGRIVNNLDLGDIQILDDSRPPAKVLQFIPQSQLPLRLGLLIDISSSVEHRFAFEKQAAEKFLAGVLNPQSDLAFVAGFGASVSVTQDFNADPAALTQGIEKLTPGVDGTSVFDAVDFASWKLAAYPDEGRVARVLIILTDGQDNSSHRSLLQSIQAAEDAGVCVYAVNTSDDPTLHTDAWRILQEISYRSGGEFVTPTSLRDLDTYLRDLANLIRSRYLIAYKPANFVPNGKYRSLQIRAAKEGKNLQVHVRRGYYARMAER